MPPAQWPGRARARSVGVVRAPVHELEARPHPSPLILPCVQDVSDACLDRFQAAQEPALFAIQVVEQVAQSSLVHAGQNLVLVSA
eukprot:7195089-Pyramimonas_sp.AAC.1